MGKTFSIVTVVKNDVKNISSTIQSVINQTFSDYEYIIIDGESSDGTSEVIQEYSDKIVCYVREKDSGIYNAMNKAVALADGDYVYFLNSGDTFFDTNVLANVSMQLGDKKDILVGKINGVEGNGNERIEQFEIRDVEARVSIGEGPCHQSIFSPTDSLKRHCFDEKLSLAADIEWFLCSFLNGVKVRNIDVIVANYSRIGVSGLAKNRKIYHYERRLVNARYFEPMMLYRSADLEIITEDLEKKQYILTYLELLLNENELGKRLDTYLIEHNVNRIGIYGAGIIGKIVYRLLSESPIEIVAFIDSNSEQINKASKGAYHTVTIEQIEDVWMDAIIVTSFHSYCEIEKTIKREIGCRVFSLEDILLEMDGIENESRY